MFRHFVHAFLHARIGYGLDAGMPYADITPIRLAPVIHRHSPRA